nr:MAG TPA: hypothetical protein [Caudoviricetes sp.]
MQSIKLALQLMTRYEDSSSCTSILLRRRPISMRTSKLILENTLVFRM